MTCSNCKKEIDSANSYAYGISNGSAYYIALCDDCSRDLTESQKRDIIENSKKFFMENRKDAK